MQIEKDVWGSCPNIINPKSKEYQQYKTEIK